MTPKQKWKSSKISYQKKRHVNYLEICSNGFINNYSVLQCDKLREEVTKVKEMLTKKDDLDPEEIRKTTSTLQQSSLKLFEMAYKKVYYDESNISNLRNF